MPILDVQHLEKHFGPTRVLEDISFELEQGNTKISIKKKGPKVVQVAGAAGSVIGAGSVFYVVASLMGGVSVFTSRCQKQSTSHSSDQVIEKLEQERNRKKQSS